MNKQVVLCLIVLIFAVPFSFALQESTYYYTTNQNNATIQYDNLDRIAEKQTSSGTTRYNYDQQFQNTLSNITSDDVNIKYEYDNRQRPVKEIVTIDGITFERNVIYDSSDRIVSLQGLGSDIDFMYNKQGKVRKIPDFISNAQYSAFGSIVNKTYANNLIASYTYDSNNNRLTSIKIPNVQDLTYTYDEVGNILTITDAMSNKLYSMQYDTLDRMVEAVIGTDIYRYGYNSIGNIMKIAKNNESKKFIYGNSPVHAPSTINEGASGVDVYHLTELESDTKNKTFEFILVNDKNDSTSGVNWSIDFGSEEASSSLPITLHSSVMVFAQTEYETVGYHNFTVSASSPGTSDTETNAIYFGARAKSLERIYSNATQNLFEFIVENDLNESVPNVSWNCSDGINSIYTTTLQGTQALYDYVYANYDSPGIKTMTCTAVTPTSQESKTVTFEIKGLAIENYDVLVKNTSKQIVSFNAKNYYYNTTAAVSVDADGDSFSNNVNLNKDEAVMVFSEVNYSSDGRKSIDINLNSETGNANYTDTFTEQGVSIENYKRIESNSTKQIIAFEIRNNWDSGRVDWNVSEPNLNKNVSLNNNQTLLVIIQNDYSQGDKQPEITARTSSFTDRITDMFTVKPLELKSFQTLLESSTRAISEMVVKNNKETSQNFNWKLNTETENVTSADSVPISSGEVMVFVENEYSDEGVYKTQALITAGSYNDAATGVVITG